MARTKQTARYSTGGSAPLPILYGSDYSESGDDSSHSSEETDYSLLSLEETIYDEKKKRDLILTVLHTQELLRYIYEFIGAEDSILFIDSHIYKHMKKSVLIISLSRSKSLEYFRHEHFRKQIKSLVKLRKKQLNLNFSYSDLHGYYKEVRVIRNCFSLNLMNCQSLTDVSKLSNLVSLNLSFCYKINDVSMLGKIHNLNLTGCTGINDFSKLGSVHCLNLSSTNIEDTRGLEKVHTLILIKCAHLKILSSIHSNINLRLDDNKHISNVGQLNNVKCLILRSLPIVDVSQLCDVSFLSISCCLYLTEIKGLNNVKLLSLYKLPNLCRINTSSKHEMLLVKDVYTNRSMSVKYIFKNDTLIMERYNNRHGIEYLKMKMQIFKVLNRDSFEVQL